MATAVEQAGSEEFIIREDLSELARGGLEYPAVAVCSAIWSVLEPAVDQSRRDEFHTAIGEIVKDVDLHGDEAFPRLVTLRRGLGEVAIATKNNIKERTVTLESGQVERYDRQIGQWHLGKPFLEQAFGDSYRYEVEGDVCTTSVVIPINTAELGFLKIDHVA